MTKGESVMTNKYVRTYECPEILKHPFYPPWSQLLIIVVEAFITGLIVGAEFL